MRQVMLVFAMVVAAGCSASKPEDGAPTTHVHTEPVVLGHFTTRDHRVTWLMSDEGPRFTVRTNGYELLASELTPTEVEARFPALSDFVRSALAGNARAVLDASASCGYGGSAVLDASGD